MVELAVGKLFRKTLAGLGIVGPILLLEKGQFCLFLTRFIRTARPRFAPDSGAGRLPGDAANALPSACRTNTKPRTYDPRNAFEQGHPGHG
jgi:hypothetical protein